MKTSDKLNAGGRENIIPFIPDDRFYFTKGVEAFEKQKFNTAVKWLRKAIESSPDNLVYQCQMAVVYTEIGAYQAANQMLHDVLQSADETYSDCYYLLANNYAHLGRWQDVKTYAELYLSTTTQGEFRADAEHLLELVNMDKIEDEEALANEAAELPVYQEAVCQHINNEAWQEAFALLEDMLTLFPEQPIIEHDYAYVLFLSGHTDEAIKMAYHLLDSQPDALNSHANLALFYYRLGELVAYNRHIEPLLNVYPIYEQQTLRIAVTLAKTGVYEEAFRRFQRLTKSYMQSFSSFYKWYSMAAFQIGQPAQASSLWAEGCRKHTALLHDKTPWHD